MRTEEGRLYLFVAIDRTSKFAFVELHEKATRRVAGDFLRHLAEALPYKVHTVLTDNGTHFTEPTGDGWTPENIREMRAQKLPFRCHSFELACADLNIEHRLTKPRHPWTNGQVERMNRTIKEGEARSQSGGLASTERQTLPLHQPRPAPAAPHRLRRRLQLRPPAQDPEGPHTL